MTREEALAEALQGILDIGKRDMTNPKYDGFFDSARAALALPAEPPSMSSDNSRAKAEALARKVANECENTIYFREVDVLETGVNELKALVASNCARKFAPVLEKLYEALEASPKSNTDCQACREWREMRDAALALFEQPDSTEVKPPDWTGGDFIC